jgi:hypothetical protein
MIGMEESCKSADESSSSITFVNASAEHILLDDLFIVPTV